MSDLFRAVRDTLPTLPPHLVGVGVLLAVAATVGAMAFF